MFPAHASVGQSDNQTLSRFPIAFHTIRLNSYSPDPCCIRHDTLTDMSKPVRVGDDICCVLVPLKGENRLFGEGLACLLYEHCKTTHTGAGGPRRRRARTRGTIKNDHIREYREKRRYTNRIRRWLTHSRAKKASNTPSASDSTASDTRPRRNPLVYAPVY